MSLRAIFWNSSGASATVLPVPAGTTAGVAWGINDAGVISGWLRVDGVDYGVTWANSAADPVLLGPGMWCRVNTGGDIMVSTDTGSVLTLAAGGTANIPFNAHRMNDSRKAVGNAGRSGILGSRAFSWTAGGGAVELDAVTTIAKDASVFSIGDHVGWDAGASKATWERDFGSLGVAALPALAGDANVIVAGYSKVGDINTGGDIALTGIYDGPRIMRAFIRSSSGVYTQLGTLGGSNSDANAMNDSGAVVGNADVSGGAVHAFHWTSGGGMVDLGEGVAFAINASSQVVGYAFSGRDYAFYWTSGGGQVLLADPIGSPIATWAYGINASGQIVGAAE